MGYSDLGCYGGEIQTPNLDKLAANGLRFTQFYNTARCSPSRASLLTGLHPHQTGIGVLTYDMGPEGYCGNLGKNCVTIPQALKAGQYKTYMSGKWHVAGSLTEPTDTWPLQRGFDEFFGTIIGAGSFYDPNTLTRGNDNIEHEVRENSEFFYTDAISDQAVDYIREHARQHADQPFFEYVAYTAPHWPLHAHDEDIAKYKDVLIRDGIRCVLKDSSVWLTKDCSSPIGRYRPGTRASLRGTKRKRKPGCYAAWRSYAAQVDRMDPGNRAHLSQLWKNRAA